MFQHSYTNLKDEDRIPGTSYRTITIVDTHFIAIISPTPSEIQINSTAYYAAHVFQEYINRNIPPMPNYLLFVKQCREEVPIKYTFLMALKNVVGIEKFKRYNNCLARLEQEMKLNDSY